MHKMIISDAKHLIFGRRMRLTSMPIKVCCHMYNSEFVNENIYSFLSNDHIRNYRD